MRSRLAAAFALALLALPAVAAQAPTTPALEADRIDLRGDFRHDGALGYFVDLAKDGTTTLAFAADAASASVQLDQDEGILSLANGVETMGRQSTTPLERTQWHLEATGHDENSQLYVLPLGDRDVQVTGAASCLALLSGHVEDAIHDYANANRPDIPLSPVNLVRDTGCAQRVQIKGDLLVVAWGWRFSATDGQGRADSLVTGRERTTDGGLVSVQTRRQAYMELHGATLELGLPASPRWLLASPLLQVSGDGTLRALGASGSLVGADTGDDAGASGPVAPVELRGGTLSLLPQGERLAGQLHGGAVAAQPQAALAVPLGAPPLLLLALGLPGLVLAAALAVRARRQAHRLVVRPGGPALQEARSAFLALYASLPAATPALAPAPLPAPAA